MYDTPILLIIFNRADTAQQVFDTIKQIRPKYLFVAADGPRLNKPEDIEKCKLTRAIIDQVDWVCEVKTLFRDVNRGCGRGPAEAITWFFENVEEGVILEDDCLPSNEFFTFTAAMLQKYRSNDKVMLVAGTNLLGKWKETEQGYHFSSYVHTWGWATWRNAWDLYDFELNQWGQDNTLNCFKEILPNRNVYNRFKEIFDYTKANINNITWWDFQWCYCVLQNRGLCVVPAVNLITNIGIGTDSTHTSNKNDKGTPILKTGALQVDYTNSVLLLADSEFDKKIYKLTLERNTNFLSLIFEGLKRNYKRILKLLTINR